MEKEILEEAAENYANQITENDEFYKLYEAFKEGAKWQQEVDREEIKLLKEELEYEKRRNVRENR